ncbi:MAG: hypothetical protein WD607_11485 [Candidatus Paceibacterota bacterium]
MIINSFRTTNCPNSNINNHSLIRVFEYADSKIIVPGDNEECSLKKLMENKEFTETVKDSDVLLAPHHGRKAGFYNEFVKLVNPRLTVVSDGRFGDTSYTSAYGTLSRGWKVHKRSGGSEERKVITTRRDGLISIKFGHGNEKPFIAVKID